ncbi:MULTISPECIES: PLP-dependent aminotransferase family protein [unclassified Vibrio]|uniref:aminotransferase-like domain-containing protein n=1 Tax=unclassified Vibrio TaxID=2614977 RepID=UPI001F2A1038|nr:MULTISPECIES: PLP-dependent aminotransferase family protein [unclassified Vibrio]QXL80168.1 Histidinol-phosphate aminotransferase [Vibrio sp.]
MNNHKFVRIADTIEEKIDSGEYAANTKLPTHRQLADELNTTPATVAKAYKLLSDKGRLESFVGKGTFVAAHSDLNEAIQVVNEDANYNFSLLQPCLHKNIPAIKNAYRQASDLLTETLIGYCEDSGHEKHREAAVKWAQQYGLEGGSIDNTLLTNGAQHALSLLVETLTEPGDTILVESLTYPGILAIANLSNRNVVGVDLDEHGLCPSALDSAIQQYSPTLIIVIPCHQNPTGVSMPEVRKKEIAQIINQHQVWLVEDDIYCFLDERPIPPIANFAPDYTFHVTALSKAISPAMRCGFIKAPDSQIALLNAHIRANIWLSSPINYIAATLLIESGEAFTLASNQRDMASSRQKIAREIFSLNGVHSTGYHVWLSLPEHWQQDRFTMEAKNRGLIVTSGSYFCVDGSSTQHIRLSLTSISQEGKLIEGLKQIRDLLNASPNAFMPF